MNNIITISIGVFLGLCIFLVFLWIIAAIIWIVYGKRYFAPNRENRENTMNNYFFENKDKEECIPQDNNNDILDKKLLEASIYEENNIV